MLPVTPQQFVIVSSHAPVRGHHRRRKALEQIGKFQVMPP